MNTQTIIASIIVAGSAFIAIRHFWRRFSTPKEKPGSCEDTACKGCPVKESCTSTEKDI